MIPIAGEAFDEVKARFFLQQGDEVLRILDDSGISGRTLRELWRNGMYKKMAAQMPECVHEVYLGSSTPQCKESAYKIDEKK